MNRFLIVPALGLAALSVSTSALAQPPAPWATTVRAAYADDERQPYYESRRAAYDNGYREGARRGEQDGRQRARAYYENDRTWQRADKGYSRSYGELERYRQQFRAGYVSGYQESYNRYAPAAGYGSGRAVPRQDPYGYPGGAPNQNRGPVYGNQGTYGNGRYGATPAFSGGVNDGIVKGREDARKRRSYDPARHEWYRDGDRHYRSQYGSRQQYENIYRDGFREGYDRGYRDLGYIR